jgi:hypothetical protein
MIKVRLRPCIVDGRRALFHRWIEKITPIVKISMALPQKELSERIKAAKESYPYLPYYTEVIAQKETLAIVELEGGEIREVKPSEVRFRDMKVEEEWLL